MDEQTIKNINGPYVIGKKYFIRTVSFYMVGILKEIYKHELVLETASCIFDTGRFNDALREGIEKQEKSDIEPYVNDVIVNRMAIVDVTEYDHNTNLKQK